FIAAPMLVAESDMILSLPRRLARRVAATAPIEVLELPLEAERFTVSMIWHERRQDDPAHAWLRRQLADSARDATRD
ncbi:LysR family transcriptional regulator, partial [Inquilinus limosus MP06]